MPALRNKPALLQLLLLVAVALYTVLPAQLVWCHEGGRAPRMEAGANGMCLSIGSAHCCGDPAAAADGDASDNSGQPGVDQAHEHCFGCSDQPAHSQQHARAAGGHLWVSRTPLAGCLYCLPLTPAGVTPPTVSGRTVTRNQAPELPLLHARATCLLL